MTMKNLQKVGSFGALLLGVSFVLLILTNVLFNMGITEQADAFNPAKVFAVASSLRILLAIPILFAVAVIALQVWMIAEGMLVWSKSKGLLEEQLPALPAAQPAVAPSPAAGGSN